MYVHIDSDSLLYKAAGCLQHTVYIAAGQVYASAQDCIAAGHTEHVKQVQLKLPEDEALEQACQIVRTYMRTIRNCVSENWPGRQYVYKTYLSSSTNFRLNICSLYKANRTQPKPILLAPVKQYFVNKYKPVVVDNYEADDACASAHVACQRAGMESVLVHIDKDLDTIVGTHLNFDSRHAYTVTPAQALVTYYRQLLTGDVSDNVKGIKGIGPVKAAAIFPADLYEQKDYKKLQKLLDSTAEGYYSKAGREADFAKNKKLLKMVTNLEVSL
jgi:5'-3' exonuclease